MLRLFGEVLNDQFKTADQYEKLFGGIRNVAKFSSLYKSDKKYCNNNIKFKILQYLQK